MPNYPMPYNSNLGYGNVGQQMYPQYQQNYPQMQQFSQGQNVHGLIWVDGEVGAKAYQLPQGLPANQPVALWDTNDTIIYLKSVNPMGMPNPIQKAHYTLEEHRGTGPAKSGAAEPEQEPDVYVRKEDMERMKQELLDAISAVNTSGVSAARRQTKGEN